MCLTRHRAQDVVCENCLEYMLYWPEKYRFKPGLSANQRTPSTRILTQPSYKVHALCTFKPFPTTRDFGHRAFPLWEEVDAHGGFKLSATSCS